MKAMSSWCPISEVVVKGSPLDHFLVTVEPDTIVHGDTATVHVQAKDSDNEDIELDGEMLLNALLDAAGQTYGKLIAAAAAGPLVEMTYEEAKGGKLRYVANGDDPTGLPAQQFKISVVLSDDETKEGIGTVAVKPSIEKFCQGKPAWGDLPYDSYKQLDTDGNIKLPERSYSISEKGCALACMAMVLHAVGLDYDPGKLNVEMTKDALFTRNRKGNWDGGVSWMAVPSYGSQKIRPNVQALGTQQNWESKTAINLKQIEDYLSKNAFVIVLVGNPDAKDPTKVRNHWVLVTGKKNGKYDMLDPGCYEGRTSLDSYSNLVYRAIIYERRQI
jgi:hypothetical protein